MSAPDFWDDNEAAQKIVDKVSTFKNVLTPYSEIQEKIDDFKAIQELVGEEGADSPLLKEADSACEDISKSLDDLELLSFLSGKYDSGNAFLSITAGAGGTESCD